MKARRSKKFRNLFIHGAGDVVQNRVRRAVFDLKDTLGIERVGYLDVARRTFENPGLIPGFESFHGVPPGRTALAVAEAAGFLGDETLVYVATPTPFHVPLAREFSSHVGRVAVEKPLSCDPIEAAGLMEFEGQVFPLGHQLFKAPMRSFLAECRSSSWVKLADVGHLCFTLCEAKGVGERQIDSAIWDLGWHGFECVVAPIVALCGEFPTIEILAVRTATYTSGPDTPHVSTAARIDCRMTTTTSEIPVSIRVGKGMTDDRKALEVFASDGRLLRVVSLAEGGHSAHRRMIEELWTQPTPDMGLGLREVLGVVEACAAVEGFSKYPFGSTPQWLTIEEPVAALS